MQPGVETLNLDHALRVIRRRLPVVALCVLVLTVAAFAYSRHEPKQYTATASLTFNSNSLSQQIAGLPAGAISGSVLLAQHASDVELVKLGDMAAKTASLLGHGLTEQKVAKDIAVTGAGESDVVSIAATAGSPTLAAAIANAYAHQFVTEQQVTNRRYFKSALALVDKQLARLTPAQRVGADGLALQDRAQTLALLAELDYGEVQFAQEALPPTHPSSPKTSRNTVLGVLLGLLLGIGLAFLLESLDRRIRGPEDLEGIYRLPLLGAVPESSALARAARPGEGGSSPLPAVEAEAFNLIRAHLRFFNVDRDLHTVVIASPAVADGKTTVARHLAEAAARLGSRVLLLEADLRTPALAAQLGIQSGPGLADVLIGAIPMDSAIRSLEVAASTTGGDGERRRLDVLPAGAVPPPNPGELLESNAMQAVLAHARSVYDLIAIDTSPLTVVSDAFPLLTDVDGVIVVGRVGRGRRDAAQRLHDVLAGSGASLLGVVVNGSKASAGARKAAGAGGGGQAGPGARTGRRGDGAVAGAAAVATANGDSPAQELLPTAEI